MRGYFYLHEVAEALLTEDLFEEDQILLVVGIGVQLGGEQGQSLVQIQRLTGNATFRFNRQRA